MDFKRKHPAKAAGLVCLGALGGFPRPAFGKAGEFIGYPFDVE
jgi:hypothetical protein